MRHQRPNEAGRAVDDDVLAGLLFQLRDLGGNITPDQVRVVPFELLQGPGGDMLGHAVEPVREPLRVLTAGPRGSETLLRHPSQEKRVRGEGLLMLELPDLIVPVRKRPFFRRLYYSVQRHEKGGRQPRHQLITLQRKSEWRLGILALDAGAGGDIMDVHERGNFVGLRNWR